MKQQNIHYPGHLVQYFMKKSEVESVIIGIVMLVDWLGWVVFKSEYNIQSFVIWKMLYIIK